MAPVCIQARTSRPEGREVHARTAPCGVLCPSPIPATDASALQSRQRRRRPITARVAKVPPGKRRPLSASPRPAFQIRSPAKPHTHGSARSCRRTRSPSQRGRTDRHNAIAPLGRPARPRSPQLLAFHLLNLTLTALPMCGLCPTPTSKYCQMLTIRRQLIQFHSW